MTTLVVCRDCNVNEFGWGVGIAEGDDGDIDVGGFLDSLSIGPWVGDDDEAGFLEGACDVVGKVTGRETTSNSNGSGVCSKFEDSALAVGTSGDDTDIGWVVDCGDNAGCEDDFLPVARRKGQQMGFRREEGLSGGCCDSGTELCKELYSSLSLPGLANVDHVDSVRTSLPQIRLHMNLQVLRSHVALCREEHFNVLRGWVEDGRKVCGRHCRGRRGLAVDMRAGACGEQTWWPRRSLRLFDCA
jgi:hypothetical protein